MNFLQAANERHSVRKYTDREIPADVIEQLRERVNACNRESGLKIQLICGEPEAFGSFLTHYGTFAGLRNYIALVGKKTSRLQEDAGYYGEEIVLTAQTLGLNTCWVALTYRKGKCAATVEKGEKLVCVIALGYGKTQGVPHKSKPLERLCDARAGAPEWFCNGMRCVMLAPTAMNQQKFYFQAEGNRVRAEAGRGFYTKLDLGIAKYHFELGAGKENFVWAED